MEVERGGRAVTATRVAARSRSLRPIPAHSSAHYQPAMFTAFLGDTFPARGLQLTAASDLINAVGGAHVKCLASYMLEGQAQFLTPPNYLRGASLYVKSQRVN